MSLSKYHDAPLTPEEQAYAAEHHGIVITYLMQNRLSFDEWYDVIVFRYLLSVKRWFAIPELHKYSFCTIAYNAMKSAVGAERAKSNRLKRKAILVSLNEPAPGFWNGAAEDAPTLSDILADVNSDFTWQYDNIS